MREQPGTTPVTIDGSVSKAAHIGAILRSCEASAREADLVQQFGRMLHDLRED
jgi:hypothetical protein